VIEGEFAMLDRKGIFWFLLITFGITYAIEFTILAMGVRFDGFNDLWARYIIMAVMWVPAVAALITTRWITREGFGGLGIRLGPVKPYLIAALLIPVLFIIVYGLTWLLGFGSPDWQMHYFMTAVTQYGGDITDAPPPLMIYGLLFVSSVIVAPFVNGLFGFGEELGWRGYLLPKLMPLGKPVAYALLGVIWGLWHLPMLLAGFNYGTAPTALAVVTFIALTTVLGVIFNEATVRTRSSILAGWLHGVFNSQRLGMWAILFPVIQPLLGGPVGLIGIIVWSGLAFAAVRYPGWLGLPEQAAQVEVRAIKQPAT
jgi:membrane protease YdiL (CAAX protease family)